MAKSKRDRSLNAAIKKAERKRTLDVIEKQAKELQEMIPVSSALQRAKNVLERKPWDSGDRHKAQAVLKELESVSSVNRNAERTRLATIALLRRLLSREEPE